MTDKEIEQALRQADDIAISEEVDCSDVLRYIKELKAEIVNLTAAKEAAETDRANLQRTLEECNECRKELSERLKAACTFDGRRTALDKNKIDEIIEEVYGL